MAMRGSCLCGAVEVEIDRAKWCAHCHCSMCRRAHGAAFVTWIGVDATDFRVLRGDSVLTRFTSSPGATRSFCGHCGSTLLFESERWAGEVHVARAAFTEVDIEPQVHAFWDDRVDWVVLGDNLRHRGGESGTEPLD